MKLINILLGIIFFCQSFALYSQNGGPVTPTLFPSSDSDYKLIWEDEFNTFNNNKWEKANDFDHYGEAQVYLPSQVNINSGKLELTLQRLPTPYLSTNPSEWGCKRQWYYHNEYTPTNTYNIGYDFSSGYVSTLPKYKVPVNTYVEANVNIPHLQGFWPAFWLFGSNDLGNDEDYEEIDIFEMLGHKPSNICGTNTHIGQIGGDWLHNPNSIQLEDYSAPFSTSIYYANTNVTFGVKWTADEIEYYINGYLHTIKANNGIYNPKTLIFNFAVSYFSTNDNKPIPDLDANNKPMYQSDKTLPTSFTNATMKINWVKVWEYNTSFTPLTNKAPYIINPLKDVHNWYLNSAGDKMYNKLATIRWQIKNTIYNNSNYYCKIEYGTTASLGNVISSIPQVSGDHLYTIELDDLTPNTKYYYKVSVEGYGGTQPFPIIRSFITAPADDSQNAKFFAYGDTRANSDGGQIPHHDDVCG